MTGTPLVEPYFEELSSSGIDWVRGCLENGEAFSRVVSSNIDINKGKAYILVATKEHEEALTRRHPLDRAVAEGYSLVPSLQLPLLLNKVRQLEKVTEPLAIVGEEDVAYPSKPLRDLPDLPTYQFHDRYVYIESLSKLRSGDDLSYIIDQVVGHSSNAFIVPKVAVPKNKEINDSDGLNLAVSTLAIISPAYHFETYTIWIGDKK